MIDTFHEHQLPVCPLGMGLVLEGPAQLLDGYISVQNSVVARTAEGKTREQWSNFPLVFKDWMIHCVCLIARHCDNQWWMSLVTKTKGWFFTSPTKQRLVETGDRLLRFKLNFISKTFFLSGMSFSVTEKHSNHTQCGCQEEKSIYLDHTIKGRVHSGRHAFLLRIKWEDWQLQLSQVQY